MSNGDAMNVNEEFLAFHFHLGLAITQWAHVEFAMAQIIVVCFRQLNGESVQTTVNGFLSIENYRSKLKYIDTILADLPIADEMLAKWSVLHKRCARLSTKRNKLAHFWVINDLHGKPGKRQKLIPKRPDESDKPTIHEQFPTGICLRDVVSFRLEFFALTRALENFADRLVPQEANFPEDQEQPQAPPSLAQLRRQIYGFASRPPRPSRA